MPSVIIPAYNEAAVIGGTLRSLLNQECKSKFEIIVACNGCKDNTAEIARSFPGVRVLETVEAGKPIALNMGDAAATMFPRIYLDADIEVSRSFCEDIKNALDHESRCVAWPQVKFDDSEASNAVKSFYKVWTSMPYNVPGRIGVGAYALNERGRGAFDRFPSIIADDGFIRGLFPNQEQRIVVETCHTTVKTPADLASLIAIKTRVRMGVYELGKKFPDVLKGHASNESHNGTEKLIRLGRNPAGIKGLLIYLWVNVLTRGHARHRLKTGNFKWERDASSRIEVKT
ncbi:MAG: glycosyltransferase [Pirellula sp.]|jgi:glycosyltransferase involved in cell wall biosynthesis